MSIAPIVAHESSALATSLASTCDVCVGEVLVFVFDLVVVAELRAVDFGCVEFEDAVPPTFS